MKLFGVILLTGYFLVREGELSLRGRELLRKVSFHWAVYLLSSASAVLTGLLFYSITQEFQPAAILLAAILPVILLRGSASSAIAGALTAFCVLRWAPDLERMSAVLLGTEGAILISAFFYQGARERMLRVSAPVPTRKSLGSLLLLFCLSLLLALVYQKVVQIF